MINYYERCFATCLTGVHGIRIITKISESIEHRIAGIDQRFAKININNGITAPYRVKIVNF
jgi:hypothetical protein